MKEWGLRQKETAATCARPAGTCSALVGAWDAPQTPHIAAVASVVTAQNQDGPGEAS